MSDTPLPPSGQMDSAGPHAALFASLVVQQSNMAMLFLGQRPHPETGKPQVDLETAGIFIETLEMLVAKTQGNLTKPEQQILQQHLAAVRLAFVEAADANPQTLTEPAVNPAEGQPTNPTEPSPAAPTSENTTDQPAADDARKRFVKRY